MYPKPILLLSAMLSLLLTQPLSAPASEAMRQMRFDAEGPGEARDWQQMATKKLFALMMGGAKPDRVLRSQEILDVERPEGASYRLVELTFSSLPDRRVHAWMAIPNEPPEGGAAGVLALHGHGGTGSQVVHGEGLYAYGKRFAEAGYVVMAPDIGSHDLQHEDWTLMGERTWDAIVALDHLADTPGIDASRLGTAGLSLGGETVMYVAALDERIRIAASSGWITTIENMKHNHCPCWDFPGLEENFEFSDIFSLVAPRPLILENGKLERAPGGFPTELARKAAGEIQRAYAAFDNEDRLHLEVHDGGHVFSGKIAYPWFERVLLH